MFKSLLMAIAIFLFCEKVYAYPNFIGHGYNACLTCHYNPYGNGPLTDYGRALGAAEISAKWAWPKGTTDEEVGERSGFLFSKPTQNWFRPSVNYRGLYLKTNPGEDNERTQFIDMMANISVVLKLDEADKLIIAASVGYTPQPLGDETGDYDNYRSREHYIGYRPKKTFGVYLGLMDKVFGLRVAEHIAFSKTITSLTMNDQSYGVLTHFNWPKVELGLNYFIGNINQDSSLRQVGATTKVEYLFNEMTKGGFSLLSSKSDLLENTIAAIHLKKGIGKGSSLLLEFGRIKKIAPQRNSQVESDYGFAQSHIKLTRGIYYVTTIEYLRGDIERSDYTMRLIPGFQVFPSQRLEFRFEAINTRNFSQTSVLEDSWSLMGQIHLWL